MQSERYFRIIRYWLKIVKSNEHRLFKNVYDMLLEMTGLGHVWLIVVLRMIN